MEGRGGHSQFFFFSFLFFKHYYFCGRLRKMSSRSPQSIRPPRPAQWRFGHSYDFLSFILFFLQLLSPYELHITIFCGLLLKMSGRSPQSIGPPRPAQWRFGHSHDFLFFILFYFTALKPVRTTHYYFLWPTSQNERSVTSIHRSTQTRPVEVWPFT